MSFGTWKEEEEEEMVVVVGVVVIGKCQRDCCQLH